MPLVVGFGDEVIIALGTFTAVVIVTLIWKSTRVRQDRIFGIPSVSHVYSPIPGLSLVDIILQNRKKFLHFCLGGSNANSSDSLVTSSSTFEHSHPEVTPEISSATQEEYDESECVTIKVR